MSEKLLNRVIFRISDEDAAFLAQESQRTKRHVSKVLRRLIRDAKRSRGMAAPSAQVSAAA